jgi:hypothetical protein
LRNVDRPSDSTTAAISFNAEFFAPAISTVPSSGDPPVTSKRSISAPS